MGKRVLDLFCWKIADIIKELPKINEQGFNFIQTSVLQENKFIGYDSSNIPWWGQFQPTSFNINNQYGTKEELIQLCTEAKKYGISISVNIIITHMASTDDGNYIYPHDLVDKKLVDNKYYWKSFDRINNWNDRWEVVNFSHGLPCLDLSVHAVQDMIVDFANELYECGVRGLRIDSGKSIKLPNESSDFFTRAINNIKHKEDLYIYAEIIFENKELIDEYCKYVDVLTSSCGSFKDKLLVFVCSHDTDYEFKITNRLCDNTIEHEYNILCEHYPNTLYYARKFSDSWKSNIVREANMK